MELRGKKEWWKKVKELGSGTFGTVCLAYSSGSSNFRVAVKSADCSFAVESLQREAEAFRHLAGAPNVVECIGEDTSVENDKLTYNLLLEYAPDGTLHDFIKKTGPLPEIQVACYAGMLLRGLAGIHARGLVHCDLKPENVLVFPGRVEALIQLKIADFGLAKFVSEGLVDKETPAWVGSGKTYYNRGDAMYASPESISCGDHGAHGDVWAIGCMVYNMMTGESMWEWNGDLEDLYDQILNWSFASLNLAEKKLSRDAKDFLFRCLNMNAQCRWSAKDLLMHPFIEKNLVVDVTQDEHVSRNARIWISERHLFSERVIEPAAASCSYMNTTIGISCQSQLV